jgi:hypothetical protein
MPSRILGQPTAVFISHGQGGALLTGSPTTSVTGRAQRPNRVVPETGTVVRTLRWHPPENEGDRWLATVEDEHGNIVDVGGGDSPERTALRFILQQVIVPPREGRR